MRALMGARRILPRGTAARVAKRFNQRRAAFFYWLFGAPNWETEMLQKKKKVVLSSAPGHAERSVPA